MVNFLITAIYHNSYNTFQRFVQKGRTLTNQCVVSFSKSLTKKLLLLLSNTRLTNLLYIYLVDNSIQPLILVYRILLYDVTSGGYVSDQDRHVISFTMNLWTIGTNFSMLSRIGELLFAIYWDYWAHVPKLQDIWS